MGATETNAARTVIRETICEASLAIIKDRGLSAVSMRSIAQRLGVSAMMPYNYYASKDELLLDLRLRLFHRFAGYMRDRLFADEPVARLQEACRAYLAYSREQPEEYRLMFETWSFEDLHSLRAKYPLDHFRSEELWDVLRMCVEACLPKCKDAGNEITHLIWCLLHGLASLDLAHKLVFGLAGDNLEGPAIEAVEAILRSAR